MLDIGHEKTGLMYTKYIHPYYCKYLPFCIRYSQSVSCMKFLVNGCRNGANYVRLLCFHTKLFSCEIQKCGQILCTHKTHFLMPGHILSRPLMHMVYLCISNTLCMHCACVSAKQLKPYTHTLFNILYTQVSL